MNRNFTKIIVNVTLMLKKNPALGGLGWLPKGQNSTSRLFHKKQVSFTSSFSSGTGSGTGSDILNAWKILLNVR
jgi:hypothetical protein